MHEPEIVPSGLDPSALERINALPNIGGVLSGIVSTSQDESFSVTVPAKHVIRLTQIYVGKLETSPTNENCLCLWIIHPDDTEKPFTEARKRKSNQHPMCPVHTKEGLISGFLEFVFKNPNVCLACPWNCDSCSKDEADCECYEHQDKHPDNDYKCIGQEMGVCDGETHPPDCPSYAAYQAD